MFRWVADHGGEPIIPFSGVLEARLMEMPEDEKLTYCKQARAAELLLTVCFE